MIMEENEKKIPESTKNMSSDVEKVAGETHPSPPRMNTDDTAADGTSQAQEEEEAQKGHS